MLRLSKWFASSFFVFLLASVSLAHGVQGKVQVVKLKLTDFKTQLKDLRENGYEVLGVNIPEGTVDVVLGDQGFAGMSLKNAKVLSASEVDTSLAPDPRYTTYAKLTTFLKNITTEFPHISRLSSIGKTLEGRDIWAVKISSNPDVNDPSKPTVVFNAMHHAREVMTTEVGMDIAEFLLTNYDSNEQVKKWVDESQIWLVPMVNPDGSNKVWTVDNMWRKNARPPNGVDINRNYTYNWGACDGSSGSTGAQDYRGPSAGSEPETQVMMNFVRTVRPTMSISFHSYSELVLYPLSCEGQHAPNHDLISKIGKEMAQKLPSDGGSGFYTPGTSWETLYAVDGGDIDFYYNEVQAIPFVIEMNQSAGFLKPFEPDYAKYRKKTVEKLRAAWGMVLDHTTGSGLSGILTSSGNVAGATVTVEGKGANALKPFTKQIVADGAFHFVLEPGMYTVTVHNGTQTETRDVTVGADHLQLSINL